MSFKGPLSLRHPYRSLCLCSRRLAGISIQAYIRHHPNRPAVLQQCLAKLVIQRYWSNSGTWSSISPSVLGYTRSRQRFANVPCLEYGSLRRASALRW